MKVTMIEWLIVASARYWECFVYFYTLKTRQTKSRQKNAMEKKTTQLSNVTMQVTKSLQ